MDLIESTHMNFRHIKNDEDEFVFQCLKDWPADERGKFTRKRAIELVDAAMTEMEFAHYPVGFLFADFREHFAVTNKEGEPIGTAKVRVWQKKVWVEHLALAPNYRSKGRFLELLRMFGYLVFEVYRCDVASFEAFADNPGMASLFARRTGVIITDQLRNPESVSGRPKEGWSFDRERYENFEDFYILKGTTPIEVTVNQAAVQQQNETWQRSVHRIFKHNTNVEIE